MQRSTADGPGQAGFVPSARTLCSRSRRIDARHDDRPELDHAMAKQVNSREMAPADREAL